MTEQEIKTQETADFVKVMRGLTESMDIDTLKAAYSQAKSRAEKYGTMVVITGQYIPEEQEMLNAQADILKHLIGFIECSRAINEKGRAAQERKEMAENLKHLFIS